MADDSIIISGDEAQVKRLQQRMEVLAKDNDEQARAVSRMGVQLSPDALVRNRLELFIAHALGGADSIDRLKFEIAWQEQLSSALAEAKQQATKARLHIDRG